MKRQYLLLIAFLSVFSLSLSAQNEEIFEKITNKTWFDEAGFAGESIVFIKYDSGQTKAIKQIHGSGVPVVSTELIDVNITNDTVYLANSAQQKNVFYIYNNRQGLLRDGKPLRVLFDDPILYIGSEKVTVDESALKSIPIGLKITVAPGIEVVKLSSKAYFYVSYDDMGSFGIVPCNGLILVNNGEAALLDTPANDERTAMLMDWIEQGLQAKLTTFIPNHWHGDCLGGLSYLQKKGVKSYANQMTIDLTREKKLPVPDYGFTDSLTVKLGDMDLCCYYPGGGHSTDNIVVWIPSEKILFGGCMVKEVHATGLGNLSDAAVNEWPSTIDKVINKYPDARIVIPGHGAIGGRELLLHTREMLEKKNK